MSFPYLMEFHDPTDGVYFSLVADAADPREAVVLAGRRLIADGSLPADGGWYDVTVSLLLKRSGVYANQMVGKFRLHRGPGDEPAVAPVNPRKAGSR